MPDHNSHWPGRWSLPNRAGALVILLSAGALMVGVASDLVTRHHADAGHQFTEAITSGYDRSHILSDDDAEDDTLSSDEAAAGASWAKNHRPQNVDECPSNSAAFRDGCESWVMARGEMVPGAR